MIITRLNVVIQELNLVNSPDKQHGSAVDRSAGLADLENPYSIYFIELYRSGCSGNLEDGL